MGAKSSRKDIIIFFAVLILSIIIYSSVQWLGPYIYYIFNMDAYLTVHTALEGLSIIMSFCIFFVTYYSFERSKMLRTILFACTFLSVGILDFFHALSYDGMPVFITQSSVAKATAFWMAARLTAALGLLAAGLNKEDVKIRTHRAVFLTAALLFCGCLSYVIILRPELIPVLYVEGQGLTPLKIILEYVIIVIKFAAMFLFYLIYRNGEEAGEYKLVILSLLLSIFSELSFTLYSNVYDIYNLLGHVYKIIAYYLIFKAKFVLNVKKPYQALTETERKLVQYTDNLEKLVEKRTAEISAANEKLMKDMDYARNIQSALLPASLPKIAKLEFAARYLPCEKIGGDFYNVFKLDDDNVGILIGDVAGHGVSAAMITVFINQNIHVRREYDDGRVKVLTPKQVLNNLYYVYNRMNFPEEIYTVMFYGILNLSSQVLTYCSAGMNTPPLILQKDGQVRTLPIQGLPICKLGGFVNPSYENQSIQLKDGDSLLFYTDGLIEIDRKRPDQFNEDNLMEYLRGVQSISASDTVEYMFDLYHAIRGNESMIDDVTVLVVKIGEYEQAQEMRQESAVSATV